MSDRLAKARARHESRPLRIGLAGLGTVGVGLLQLLRSNRVLIENRAGRSIEVVAVSAKNRKKRRDISLDGLRWHADPLDLAVDPDIDVVVELIGGAKGISRDLAYATLAAGKGFVSANKALLAAEGMALAALAERKALPFGFEAAVAGAVPILKVTREALAGNRIERVYGILNGTCNYILTEMRETGRDFAQVLAEAQAKGYAEADPTFDVDGVDSAHKLAILASLAFNSPVNFSQIYCEGIRRISAIDIAFAEELGFRIKLLAIARRQRQGKGEGIEARVHPCLVPKISTIAHVNGVSNAVVAEGDFSGPVLLQGQGAGPMATASAVAADLIDIAAGRMAPAYGLPANLMKPLSAISMDKHRGRYYMRLMMRDQAGVIAGISAILRDQNISIESLVQHGRAQGNEAVPVVIVTHEAQESAMKTSLKAIGRLRFCLETPHIIRIEET